MSTTKRQTKVIDGIEVTINPEILADYDVLMKMSQVMVPDGGMDVEDFVSTAKRLKTLDDLMTTVFGAKQFDDVKERLRKKHDGVLPIEALVMFFNDVFAGFQAKN